MRDLNPEIVAMCAPAAWKAVRVAMERLHDADPAKFHAQRPTMETCQYGDKLLEERPPTDKEVRARLRARDLDPLKPVRVIERCPFL